MTPNDPYYSISDPPEPHFAETLPIGLLLSRFKSSPAHPDCLMKVSPSPEPGLNLVFLPSQESVRIILGEGMEYQQAAGMGLMLLASGKQMLAIQPPLSSMGVLFISRSWISAFMRDNTHFSKIEEELEGDHRVLVCRLDRRHQSHAAAILASGRPEESDLSPDVQSQALSLLEYFLCNRHRSLLGEGSSATLDKAEDMALIREVESYIDEFYCSDTFTVDSILKKTYTSYHKLNYLFKTIHGMTISEYIRNKRIEKSKEMIADNVKSISQIAYEIGYSSISNYILAFKKMYRITPGKYKKQIESLA